MSTSPDHRGQGRVQIGWIAGAHGIGGELRIHPTTDFPKRFFGMKTLRLECPGKPDLSLDIIGVRPHEGKGQILVSVAGVTDRDSAESLKGRAVTVDPEDRVDLPEGEYWIDSLIGLDVIDDRSGDHLGKIEDVMDIGSNDIYQVRADDGTLKLIPAIEDVVRGISLEDGVIRVILLEGLWD
ncbi:MAG: ribosome maturation factor RimM [Synergistaceae bacterium]|jgi:16S rRNA processing protein RimM|nr:ribosome maturation factor RimM [Synergistaceae bacterium]